MKFKLDFLDIEDFIKVTDELVEAIEDIQSQIADTVEVIKESNEGKIIEAFEKINDEKVEELDKLKDKIEEFNEDVQHYYDEFQEIDEEEIQGEYEIDTDVENNFKHIERILKDVEYSKDDRHLENEMDNYDKKMREYHEVDSIINLQEEYPDDENTQDYIINQRDKIEEQMSYYRHNREIYDEAEYLLKKLEREL